MGKLLVTKFKTGLVYDKIFLEHDQQGHPENANRLKSIIDGLESKKLFEKVELVNPRLADEEEISICHSINYIHQVKEFCEKGGGYFDPDTYSNRNSFTVAATVVGSSIDLTKLIIDGKLNNGFALVRPPGHHALSNKSMGFCLFGNITIVGKIASAQPSIKRVAIVDFDVHHGNGTQALVGDDPNILFISTHQYPFYPGTGGIREIGEGEAQGTIINIPFLAGVGDENFKVVYEKIIIPALKRFMPDIILVSAGYDAHWDDPLANLSLSLEGYDWISRKLIKTAEELCSGKIVFFLEGGYNLEVLKNGVANTIRALLGINSFDDPLGKSTHKEQNIEKLIKELITIHGL